MLTAYAILFSITCIGISETSYLIKKRLAHQKPICPLGERCDEVLESRYNRIFFVPNDILGLLFYIMVAIITSLLVIEVGPRELLDTIGKFIIFAGALFSIFLLFLQWKVIRAWCSWCVASALTTFIMAAIIILNKLSLLLQ